MASQQPWPCNQLPNFRMRTELLCTQPYPKFKFMATTTNVWVVSEKGISAHSYPMFLCHLKIKIRKYPIYVFVSYNSTKWPVVRWCAVKAYITTAIWLRYDYDTTIPRRIQLRRKWSKLRFAFDSTATRLRRKIDLFIFCSRRIASNGSRRARYVVVGLYSVVGS